MIIENLSPYRKWNVKALVLCNSLIIFLIGTYLWPLTQPLWDWVDVAFFKLINGSLNGPKWWQTLWAMANHRYADWIEDIAIIVFFALYIRKAQKYFRLRRIAEFLFCILYAGLIIYFVNRILFREFLHIPRPCPTFVVEGSIRLSKRIDWMTIKDTAARSFPGDHATTALLFAGTMLFFAKGRLAIIASIYAIFLCLPRLITGAHWLSDVFVGSLPIALLFLSWAFFTPLHSHCILAVEKFLRLFKIKKVNQTSDDSL